MNLVSGRVCGAACVLTAIGVLGGLAGCQQQPKQGPTGVTRSDERIYGETRDPAADTVTLTEFSNRVSQAIVSRISGIPEITQSPTKVVIMVGGIENRSNTPQSDFDQIRRRVFAGLVNSNIVRQHADIVEAPEIMDAQRARLGGAPGMGRYDPNLTFILNGFFSEQSRLGGGVSNYYLDMTLTNLGSGQILFAEQYDFKQVR